MNWIPIKGDPKLAKDNPCLAWIWDKDLRVGYVYDEQVYWSGHRWVDGDGKPAVNHPDYEVTNYCVLPKPKGRRNPGSA